jgi:tRNA 2-thiouridine synthesizing protein A
MADGGCSAPAGGDPPADAEWDAGNMSCGELVMELRRRLRALAAGSVLRVVARDPGAPEDLPAWCRLTGHSLLAQRHPVYWVRRKEG